MDHNEMIDVLQAARDGKAVEYRCLCGCGGGWHELNPLVAGQEWRIKPEPKVLREWYINLRTGIVYILPCPETVHVREVLEDEPPDLRQKQK